MQIKIDYKKFKNITKKSNDWTPYSDGFERHDCYIIRQALLYLAGKPCNKKTMNRIFNDKNLKTL